MFKRVALMLMTAGAVLSVIAARAQPEHGHAGHSPHPMESPSVADPRTIVQFPEALRIQTLANMRDHLVALSEIQAALAREAFEEAAGVAEQRLGMSSLPSHGAHEVANYMPEAMRSIGTEMHQAASRFALAASNATVTGDLKPALARLAQVTRQCVACHNGYRVQ